MKRRRIVPVVTGVCIAVLAGGFALLGPQEIERVAAAVSALVAIASLGVGVMMLRSPTHRESIRVVDSGDIRRPPSSAGNAVTGIDVKRSEGVDATVERSGDVEGGGDAVTGYRRQ